MKRNMLKKRRIYFCLLSFFCVLSFIFLLATESLAATITGQGNISKAKGTLPSSFKTGTKYDTILSVTPLTAVNQWPITTVTVSINYTKWGITFPISASKQSQKVPDSSGWTKPLSFNFNIGLGGLTLLWSGGQIWYDIDVTCHNGTHKSLKDRYTTSKVNYVITKK